MPENFKDFVNLTILSIICSKIKNKRYRISQAISTAAKYIQDFSVEKAEVEQMFLYITALQAVTQQ